MRKIRDVLFEENVFSSAVFLSGMLAIMVIFWLTMKRFIFGYFIWMDEVYSGTVLNYVYIAVGISIVWVIDDWCSNKSIIRMVTAGMTPIATVLALRWVFAGYITAKLLLAVMIIYSVFMAAQTIRVIVRKKRIRAAGKGLNNILTVLSAVSLIGMAGYCLTGMGLVNAPEDNVIAEAEDGQLWDSNQDILRPWKEETYAGLSDDEKRELFQQLVELECTYWGIEPVKLTVEEYDSESLMGYYVDEAYIISIREEMFDMPREEVMETLLHETHHAYVHKAVESVDWDDEDIEKNKDLRIYKELRRYKEGIENYVQADTDYNSYYNNPIEVAAREYSEEWTTRYLDYIDRI